MILRPTSFDVVSADYLDRYAGSGGIPAELLYVGCSTVHVHTSFLICRHPDGYTVRMVTDWTQSDIPRIPPYVYSGVQHCRTGDEALRLAARRCRAAFLADPKSWAIASGYARGSASLDAIKVEV